MKKMIKDFASLRPNYQAILFCDNEAAYKTIMRYLNDKNVSSQAYLMKENNDEEQRLILQKYQESEYQVIMSSESLSIGINNQNTRILINVDLPNKRKMEDFIGI